MADYRKGMFAYLFNCAPEDPLDTMLYEYAKTHEDSGKGLGFSDPQVQDQLWSADALSKSAIYDQFYTFMCWGCPVACNFFVTPCCDWTDLERHMANGTAPKMTCGPCGGSVNGTVAEGTMGLPDYIYGRQEELIIIASCPGDIHGYYPPEMASKYQNKYGKD